jgi:hypothetical protein
MSWQSNAKWTTKVKKKLYVMNFPKWPLFKHGITQVIYVRPAMPDYIGSLENLEKALSSPELINHNLISSSLQHVELSLADTPSEEETHYFTVADDYTALLGFSELAKEDAHPRQIDIP